MGFHRDFYYTSLSREPLPGASQDENGNWQRQNFTCGVSLGATRNLDFISENDYQNWRRDLDDRNRQGLGEDPRNRGGFGNSLFSFPQRNGDVFAFSDFVNDNYRHGVAPIEGSAKGRGKSKKGMDDNFVGPRISVVIWGQRKLDKKSLLNQVKGNQAKGLGKKKGEKIYGGKLLKGQGDYEPYKGEFQIIFHGRDGEKTVHRDQNEGGGGNNYVSLKSA